MSYNPLALAGSLTSAHCAYLPYMSIPLELGACSVGFSFRYTHVPGLNIFGPGHRSHNEGEQVFYSLYSSTGGRPTSTMGEQQLYGDNRQSRAWYVQTEQLAYDHAVDTRWRTGTQA